MTAELMRDDDGRLFLLLKPVSSTEGVAMDDHAKKLGFVWDDDYDGYVRKAEK